MTGTPRFAEEIAAPRRGQPFVPFEITLSDGKHYLVREASSFAIGEKAIMLATAAAGMVTIRFADIAGVEERPVMSDEQAKTREDLVAHLNRAPFAPFTIELTDGTSCEIVRRFQAGIGLTRGRIATADGKSGRNFHISEIRGIRDVVTA